MILVKSAKCSIKKMVSPRSVTTINVEGKSIIQMQRILMHIQQSKNMQNQVPVYPQISPQHLL